MNAMRFIKTYLLLLCLYGGFMPPSAWPCSKVELNRLLSSLNPQDQIPRETHYQAAFEIEIPPGRSVKDVWDLVSHEV